MEGAIKFFGAVVLIALLLGLLLAVMPNQHARDRHGAEADWVASVINSNTDDTSCYESQTRDRRVWAWFFQNDKCQERAAVSMETKDGEPVTMFVAAMKYFEALVQGWTQTQ